MASHQRETLRIDNQQAAALFRLHVTRCLSGCQYEGGKMRWWLAQGLLLELIDGEWHLSMIPTRGCEMEHVMEDLAEGTEPDD